VDPAIGEAQAAKLAKLRDQRDGDEVRRRLDELRGLAEKEGAQAEEGDMSAGNANLLYPLREALRARATVGEVCDALRDVWGVYVPPDAY
jgi:methylmalonyl-CoA mutase N-terminal domain/subunit